MRRMLHSCLALTAAVLTIGCQHVAGINDCAADLPLCVACQFRGGCVGGGRPGQVIMGTALPSELEAAQNPPTVAKNTGVGWTTGTLTPSLLRENALATAETILPSEVKAAQIPPTVAIGSGDSSTTGTITPISLPENALAASVLTIGCQHVAGINDCAGGHPLCVARQCGERCVDGGRPGPVTIGTALPSELRTAQNLPTLADSSSVGCATGTITPIRLPEKVVRTWQAAGAEPGWLCSNSTYYSLDFVRADTGKAGDIAAFRFAVWQEGTLAKLPDLGQPFGLDLHGTKLTDAGLKELASLKGLQSLNLAATKVTDTGLKQLAELRNLQSLDLSDTQVTGAGLKELARLKSLRVLGLWSTKVTDAGLKELTGLQDLQLLNLGGTEVTDAGLKELAGLKGLQSLNLDATKVTDVGLKELTGLKSLQFLNLGDTKVTDAGLKNLAGLKSLQTLHLAGTKLTDAGLRDLETLQDLQSLSLWRTKVTDAGLKELAELKSLQSLDLSDTKVTDAGLKELQNSLARCRISGP